ncbi:DNA-binding response regulator [Pseudonocardia hispaniensis]|uniref:DNA-binding response regulator n=1 Tax=Pseudonocardia hispaniensis TaxID=904933 RepID=A0ABW1J6Z1_9PSEU
MSEAASGLSIGCSPESGPDEGAGEPPGVVVVGEGAAADGLAGDLRAAGLTVAGTVAVAAAAAPLAGPGTVIVADVGGGAEIVAELVATMPTVPVLAVAADPAHGLVLAAVRAGAAGFVVRTSAWIDVPDAVRRIAAGETVFTPGLAAEVLDSYSGGVRAGAPRLTQRESEVLALVVEGLTARQIATRLVLSPRTVENHVQRMLRKLELSGRAALVRYAIENCLV